MKKLLAISAVVLLTAGGTVWAAVSLPSASAPIHQPQDKTQDISVNTPTSTTPDTMGHRRRRGHHGGGGGGGGGDHICGSRFCGHHCHHHGHVWCDGYSHWYCPGHY